jgi:hypothetical protein
LKLFQACLVIQGIELAGPLFSQVQIIGMIQRVDPAD